MSVYKKFRMIKFISIVLLNPIDLYQIVYVINNHIEIVIININNSNNNVSIKFRKLLNLIVYRIINNHKILTKLKIMNL